MMKQKWMAIFLAVMMALSLTACGEGEETTLTGMVVSVDGTLISLMEMDAESMSGMDFSGGERGELPEGMEDFQGFGSFNPGDVQGAFPEGEGMPQWGEGEMPEMPEGMTPPEGMTMPENGQFPGFSGEGGMLPGMGSSSFDGETRTVDIGKAHISVEIEGGKESGSLSDIQPGTFVTITVNGKGEATYVLISSMSGYGSFGGFGGFIGFGGFGNAGGNQ